MDHVPLGDARTGVALPTRGNGDSTLNVFEAMIILPYNVARPLIKDADLLQFSGAFSIASRGIKVAGRSRYSHSAMAGWDDKHLMCFEVREWVGGRITNLSAQVRKHPNRISVYRPSRTLHTFTFDPKTGKVRTTLNDLNERGAVNTMRDFANPDEYGWLSVFASGLLHLPFVRWFTPISTEDLAESNRPPYCSGAVAYSYRKNFTDVVRETPDARTLPGDLTRSPLFTYLFTLGPEDRSIEAPAKYQWHQTDVAGYLSS